MPIKLITNTLLIAVLLLSSGMVHAAKPILAQLQYQEAGKIKSTPIHERTGTIASPVAGKPQAVWLMSTGATRSGDVPPQDRVIRLYHSVDGQLALLCTVLVKYYPHNGKWQPTYRMEERVILRRDGADFKPIPSGTGDIRLSLLLGTSLPNVDGYFSRLQFGFPSDSVSIDAWEVN